MSSPVSNIDSHLQSTMQQIWGYDGFRPLQREAMLSVMEDRDSLIVMPTGGGKSLCYQVPAMCKSGLAVIASPLISLMKDQVDALVGCGISAACINSAMDSAEKRDIADQIRAGELKILYLAPERLVTERMLSFLQDVDVSFFAIDESHCISEWGHDFRPEYRQLSLLKKHFPNVGVHAYTATATSRVQQDIRQQLGFVDPQVYVGSFDRPNLTYRVIRRQNRMEQIRQIIGQHQGESGIIYCIRRADVEEIAKELSDHGISALPYHAGLTDKKRHRNQEYFIKERASVIVATVAFGMGIDKSNVRFVIHAGLPKSLENYQQESGRAGRDGLEAECVLLYSGSDLMMWKRMQADLPADAQAAANASLNALDAFCMTTTCRHQALVSYFGQTLDHANCNACDVCLGDLDTIDDSLIVSQKILSGIVRTEQRFGADYNAKVLIGSSEKRITEMNHDQLSTYGILSQYNLKSIRMWMDQLVGQGLLKKVGEYNVLNITSEGLEVLRGNATPVLTQPTESVAKKSKGRSAEDWSGVDKGLFEELKSLRRDKSEEAGVPPYIVFGDAALREMARGRPTTSESFRRVKGVGERKCEVYAESFTTAIREYCDVNGLEADLS